MVGSAALRSTQQAQKQFLESHLTTYKVVMASNDDDDDTNNNEECCNTTDICKMPKGDLILPASYDDNDNDDEDETTHRPMCAICVSPYCLGETICWSTHDECHHCFHAECIQKWLLGHVECPCCRLPFWKIEQEKRRCESTTTTTATILRQNYYWFSPEEEANFQQMIANLRESYRSMLLLGRGMEESRIVVVTHDHDDDDDDASTIMDNTSRTEEGLVVSEDEENDQRQLPVLVDNTGGGEEDNADFGDVELGTQDDHSNQQDAASEHEHEDTS